VQPFKILWEVFRVDVSGLNVGLLGFMVGGGFVIRARHQLAVRV
jgi:hypothetical protein